MAVVNTDGILFDMDGTVWDNTGVFAKAWMRGAKDQGIEAPMSADILKSLFGKTMKDIADTWLPDVEPSKRYETLEICERYEMDDLRSSDEDTCYEGLEDALKAIYGKIPMYIVSNCQSGYIETFYEMTGLGKYFEDFLCYGDNGLGKADNIRNMVDKHGIKNAVYFGDIQADQIASSEAGVDFIWAAYGYGKNVQGAVGTAYTVSDLPKLVL